MCDDLYLQHVLLLSPSHIPLSLSPPWYTTQYTLRTQNRSLLFLPSGATEPINSHFFTICPNWRIISYCVSPSKRLLSHAASATRISMSYELFLSSRPGATSFPKELIPEDKGNGKWRLSADSTWYSDLFPSKSQIPKREDVISLLDTSTTPVHRSGYITILSDSTRILITELSVSSSLHHSVTEGEVIKRLLKTVADIASPQRLKLWILLGAEEVEKVAVAFEMGFVVNRMLWIVESNAGEEGEVGGRSEKRKGKWELGNWEGGMRGWREQWTKALEGIISAKA